MLEHIIHAAAKATDARREPPRYCYFCRRVHPPEHPMRRVATRNGYRWRCLATLDVARLDPAARDALGREKSEANRLLARLAMEQFNRHRAARLAD